MAFTENWIWHSQHYYVWLWPTVQVANQWGSLLTSIKTLLSSFTLSLLYENILKIFLISVINRVSVHHTQKCAWISWVTAPVSGDPSGKKVHQNVTWDQCSLQLLQSFWASCQKFRGNSCAYKCFLLLFQYSVYFLLYQLHYEKSISEYY